MNLAFEAKKDPIEFRLEMMDEDSRLASVLKLVQEKSIGIRNYRKAVEEELQSLPVMEVSMHRLQR
jgi:hypothetical protein